MPRTGTLAHISVRAGGMDPVARPVVERIQPCIDPIRSASRTIRAVLVRKLAGVEFVCSEACALSPLNSIYDDDRQRLHEPDLSPRPALVAFDLMAELLNDASEIHFAELPPHQSQMEAVSQDTLSLQLPVVQPGAVVPVIELFLE